MSRECSDVEKFVSPPSIAARSGVSFLCVPYYLQQPSRQISATVLWFPVYFLNSPSPDCLAAGDPLSSHRSFAYKAVPPSRPTTAAAAAEPAFFFSPCAHTKFSASRHLLFALSWHSAGGAPASHLQHAPFRPVVARTHTHIRVANFDPPTKLTKYNA